MSSSLHVLDSHVVLWLICAPSRLSEAAMCVLQDPTADLILPAICLAEMGMAIERNRIPIKSFVRLLSDIEDDPRIVIKPITPALIRRAMDLTSLRDIHDRLVVATAQSLVKRHPSATLLTADREVRDSGLVALTWSLRE